jgi:ribonuclease PH
MTVPDRAGGRARDALRPVTLSPRWLPAQPGSVLLRQGDTWLLCTATVEDRVPHWMRGRGRGWLTATYSLLPASTADRSERERRGPGGRTHEIERLIGRALRPAVDLGGIGERTLHVDCDVLQADGGTRTAAITGGWLALALALVDLRARGVIAVDPLVRHVAAVSVGMVDGLPALDLDYAEDLRADTDMNVIMASDGGFVEIQGTAEGVPFARSDLDGMLDLAAGGVRVLLGLQREALGGV